MSNYDKLDVYNINIMKIQKRTDMLSVRIPKKVKQHFATRALQERKTLSDIINESLAGQMETDLEENENNNQRKF